MSEYAPDHDALDDIARAEQRECAIHGGSSPDAEGPIPMDEHGAMLCCGGWEEQGHQPGCPVPMLLAARDQAVRERDEARERIASLLLNEPSKTQGLYAAIDELQAALQAAEAREREAVRERDAYRDQRQGMSAPRQLNYLRKYR